MPLITMPGEDVYVTNHFTDEMLDKKDPDIIYYNRIVGDEVWKQRVKRGFKIAVDVDDHWLLNPGHVAYRHSILTDYSSKCIEHMRKADVVTCTHERLADQIKRYNNNVHVIPNAIPNHEYFAVNKTISDNVRIFWQGSITHEHDIKILQHGVKGLFHSGVKPKMVIAGITESPVWVRMCHTYIDKHEGMVLAGKGPHEYYQYYQHADICVIPLLANAFNTYKSNLKFLEAAHSSLPVICSEVDPYLNLPVLYAQGKKDWQQLMSDLINDADMRKALGEVNKDYVDKHFNYNKINEARKQAILR